MTKSLFTNYFLKLLLILVITLPYHQHAGCNGKEIDDTGTDANYKKTDKPITGTKDGPAVPPLNKLPKLNKENLKNNDKTEKQPQKPSSSTELTTDPLQNLLIVSSLDGTLTALDRFSGEIRWVSKDTKPMIQVPPPQQKQPPNKRNQRLPKTPYFLPDPKTGSLYMMGKQNSLRKLPFTIPQLVSMAPCRNSEGLMYTGRKFDTWVLLNPYTGEKQSIDEPTSFDSTCPLPPPLTPTKNYCTTQTANSDHHQSSYYYPKSKSILIGKTEYTLSMMDGPRKWNVSYNLYASLEMNPQSVQDYDLVHFTSPSEGHVLTYDRSSGDLLWQSLLQSPVIALYSLESSQLTSATNLLSVPFNPIASDTLDRLRNGDTADSGSSPQKALSPTTYVGECAYGLYAVPALADEHVLLIGDGSKLPPLLAGPSPNPDDEKLGGQKQDQEDQNDYLLLGYYQSEGTTTTTPPQQIESSPSTPPSPQQEQLNGPFNDSSGLPPVNVITETVQTGQNPERSNAQFPPLAPLQEKKTIRKEVKIVFTTAIISIAIASSIFAAVFIAYRRYKNNQLETAKNLLSGSSSSNGVGNSNGGDPGSGGSNGRVSGGSGSSLISMLLPDGNQELSVGKIQFNTGQVLGKGCEGTFVFRGKFEGRDVAVKRILPECFAFADREVDLLKESDQHVNVIRYFCTETDGQFRYIALELCVATLSDWVEGRYVNDGVDGVRVLREATEGLAHLHSLRIVHRDVKPANVLLSEIGNGRMVRTLISDFGLCKKIQSGRMSYSRRSGGVPGTDGWIAPEVIAGDWGMAERGDSVINGGRMTYAVDIFSMGCVFFYVLSKGHHPFGNAFRRQSNIIMGQYDISKISDEDDGKGVLGLTRMMISMNPEDRPPLEAVLKHPVFWDNAKVLGFFLDVSDRIEKESEEGSSVLRRLENEEMGSREVVKGDWRDHICQWVAMDLRKYRTYKGGSVRDLLRALRNKKNHYRELEREAQISLGAIPDQFVEYWVGRFPRLLEWTWRVFEGVKTEGVFKGYYSEGYNFFEESGIGCDGDGEEYGGMYVQIKEQRSAEHELGKDFWKSKSQGKYQRWRRGGGGRGGSSPRKFNNGNNNRDGGAAMPSTINELSASTDNYWRGRGDGADENDGNRSTSKSPARRRMRRKRGDNDSNGE